MLNTTRFTDWATDQQIRKINKELPKWRDALIAANLKITDELDARALASRGYSMVGYYSCPEGIGRLFYDIFSLSYFLYDPSTGRVKNTADRIVGTAEIAGATYGITELLAMAVMAMTQRMFLQQADALRILIAIGEWRSERGSGAPTTIADLIHSIESWAATDIVILQAFAAKCPEVVAMDNVVG